MRRLLIAVAAIVAVVMVAGVASATPFYEEFLGSKTDGCSWGYCTSPYGVNLYEGWEVTFNFDLTARNNQFIVKDEDGNVQQTGTPTVDETGYDPTLYFPPHLAYLTLTAYSVDLVREKARVKTSVMDGDKVLWEGWFWLSFINGPRATIRFDLGDEGLLDYLADGQLGTIVMALDTPWWNINDFGIEQATLYAEADPVPEPATLLLLGSGLIGLAGIGRKRLKR